MISPVASVNGDISTISIQIFGFFTVFWSHCLNILDKQLQCILVHCICQLYEHPSFQVRWDGLTYFSRDSSSPP